MGKNRTTLIFNLQRCFSLGESVEKDAPRYLLSKAGEMTIGRDLSCQIVIEPDWKTVSRIHAKVQPVEGAQNQWQICDLNSPNGIYINGKRIPGTQILELGDRIMLGQDGPEFLFECQEVTEVVQEEPINDSSIFLEQPSPSDKASTSQTNRNLLIIEASAKEVTQRNLWALVTNNGVLTLSAHSEAVRAVAFNQEGDRLASGSADKTIKIWDLDTREVTQTFSGHKLAVSAVAFSPDGKTLASGSGDKLIKLWKISTGEESRTITGHSMGVNTLAFSPDGKQLASGSADKLIKLWNLQTGEETYTLAGHKFAVNAIAFNPHGKMLASGGMDRTVKLWNSETGEEGSTLPALRSSVTSLTFSPDGQILAIGGDDKLIRLWNLTAEQEVYILARQSWQTGGVAISADGQRFACGCDNTIKVWSA